jgi:hypothetical protein
MVVLPTTVVVPDVDVCVLLIVPGPTTVWAEALNGIPQAPATTAAMAVTNVRLCIFIITPASLRHW